MRDTVLHAFLRLWALAHVVHFLRRSSSIDPSGWILLAAACAVVVAPSRWYLVAFLAIVDIMSVLAAGMYVDNHAIIMMFGNLAILASIVQHRSAAQALTTIRWTLLIAYSAAAFAKLNTGFFDPDVSCTTEFLGRYTRLAANWFGLDLAVPVGVVSTMPFVIAAAEIAVPLLLAVRRTRNAAVLLIIPLHLSMSLNPYGTGSTFTVLIIAVAFLFLSANAQRLVTALTARVLGRLVTSPLRQAVTFACLWIFLGWVRTWGRSVSWLTPASSVPNHTLITVATLVLVAVLVSAILKSRSMAGARLPWMPPSHHVPLIALVIVHAMNPYLGLSTVPVFTMYSNLRTEGGLHNHLIVPRAPWRTTQDVLVEMVPTTNPEVVARAPQAEWITLHEARRLVHLLPEASLTFRLNGALHTHTSSTTDPLLQRANPIAEFFIHHRSVPMQGSTCQW